MARTQAQLTAQLSLLQCCIADKALNYIQKEVLGRQDIDEDFNMLCYIQTSYAAINCVERVLDDIASLTQTKLEAEIEKIDNICGCTSCKSSSQIFDDTLPTGFNNILT